MSRQNIHFRNSGASLIELLVAAIVLGVAVTGITELIWLNTSWTSKYFNKTGSNFYLQNFLSNIRSDIDLTYAIGSSSNGQSLTLLKTSKNGFDSVGYPLASGIEQIQYSCQPETLNGVQTGKFVIERANLTKNTKATLLKNISGPTKVDDTSVPVIFQYVLKKTVSTDTNFGVVPDASVSVGSVIVNVELTNREMGKSVATETNATAKPDLGIRTEFFTRSELSAL